MDHGSPKSMTTLLDEQVMLEKELKQTKNYYKRMVKQRDAAIHKLNIEENKNRQLRFKFVAQDKKVKQLDDKIFELKMKNADLVLALNKAQEKHKNLTAQITDLFGAGEETLAVSPPSSPVPNSVHAKEENGTPEKPRKRARGDKQVSAKTRRCSQRLKVKQQWDRC